MSRTHALYGLPVIGLIAASFLLKVHIDAVTARDRLTALEQALGRYVDGSASRLDSVASAAADVPVRRSRRTIERAYGEHAEGAALTIAGLADAFARYRTEDESARSNPNVERLTREIEAVRAERERWEAERERYERRAFVVMRLFDTDAGRGVYDAIDTRSARRVVLIADELQARTDFPGQEVVLYVEDGGERPVVMTERTPFDVRERTEYLTHYTAQRPSEPPAGIYDLEVELMQARQRVRQARSVARQRFLAEACPLVASLQRLPRAFVRGGGGRPIGPRCAGDLASPVERASSQRGTGAALDSPPSASGAGPNEWPSGKYGPPKPNADAPIASGVTPASTGAWGAGRAYVDSPGDGFLALRSEPTIRSGHRLVRMPHGAAVVVRLCRPERVVLDGDEGRWCEVSFGGQAGWAFDAYLIR